jgi:MurNAc alpha-1-phosphate uridylyltransferase
MKTMLLAAGLGTRMRPLTDHTPKPLLPVGGRPLIEHHLLRLAEAGFVDIVINLAHLGQQIEDCLGDGSRLGVSIEYSREAQPLETGGGIFRALPLLGPQPFLVLNGDVWTDYPLGRLRDASPQRGHLVMVDNPRHLTHGDFFRRPDGVLSEEGSGAKLTYAGIAVFHPDLFAGCEPGVFPLRPLFVRALREGLLTSEYYGGQWLDVGTPERLQEADLLARQRGEAGRS